MGYQPMYGFVLGTFFLPLFFAFFSGNTYDEIISHVLDIINYCVPANMLLIAFMFTEKSISLNAYSIVIMIGINVNIHLLLVSKFSLTMCYIATVYILIIYNYRKRRITYIFYEEESDTICTICQYGLIDKVRILSCKHAYHFDCIEKWLNVKTICPLCRNIEYF